MYNALISQHWKDALEEWAKRLYPAIWEEIETLGRHTMKEGHQVIKLPGLQIVDWADDEDEADSSEWY